MPRLKMTLVHPRNLTWEGLVKAGFRQGFDHLIGVVVWEKEIEIPRCDKLTAIGIAYGVTGADHVALEEVASD